MKRMKKFIALALCVLTVFSVCMLSVSAYGVSVGNGMDALRAQFLRGKGPKTDGYAIDYSYYSPVRSSDTVKYPLVVILPGQGESGKEGDELKMNEFCTWSASEYQSRFARSKGAFILIARAREDALLSWNSESLVNPLAAAVRDFAKKQPNVDTSRIYVLGWSYGGMASLRVAAANPDLFAGVVSICPPITLNEDRAKNLSGMAVWLIASKNDTVALYDTMTSTTWKRIKDNSANKADIRFTTYTDVPNTDHIINHNGWREVIDDFDYNKSGYSGRKTVDGNGKTVAAENGMISWLSTKALKKAPTLTICKCDCHSTNPFTKFIWSVRVFFWRIFSSTSNRTCACGVKHW